MIKNRLPDFVSVIVEELVNDQSFYEMALDRYKRFLRTDRFSYKSLRSFIYSTLRERYYPYGPEHQVITSKVTYEVMLYYTEQIGYSQEEAVKIMTASAETWVVRGFMYGSDICEHCLKARTDIQSGAIKSNKPEVTTFTEVLPMAAIINIPAVETKTFVYGQDASQVSDATIFNTIANLEKEIESLGKIENKLKALVKRIEDLKADIAALVKLSDDRQ